MACTGCGACCDNLGFNLTEKRGWIEHVAGPPHFDDDPQSWLDAGWTEARARRARLDAEFILAHWKYRPDAADAFDTTCDVYDPVTRRCGDYENRPPVCRDYPYYSDGPNLARLDLLPEQCGYRDDWQPVVLVVKTAA